MERRRMNVLIYVDVSEGVYVEVIGEVVGDVREMIEKDMSKFDDDGDDGGWRNWFDVDLREGVCRFEVESSVGFGERCVMEVGFYEVLEL